MHPKLRSTHLERKAVVYLRQSSLRQVRTNRESTQRQYALNERAAALGWSASHIQVIDEDLGSSGRSSDWRKGFQSLAEDIAQGRVGAVFALEVSRLARSSADWHRLLELAGLADVVIGDEDCIYNPKDYNDRLLLGLKGQFADAELYWMRLRLQGGIMSKARRGELAFLPPTGYVRTEEGLNLDPDEQVQRATRLVFERFKLDGTAYAIVRYFAKQGLSMPIRDPASKDLQWRRPSYARVIAILHNPIYTGAYIYGRREERAALVSGQLRKRKTTHLPIDEWKVKLFDHHPAYLSWEEFMDNQQRLKQNRSQPQHPEQRGAPREGAALLQGLVLCGCCGARMQVGYWGKDRHTQYECRRGVIEKAKGRCLSVSGEAIHSAVESHILSVLQPPEIDLSLAVTRDVERQGNEIERQWHLRLERAKYEARLSERRYKAVDPDNRTIARALEREWNERLEALERLQSDYDALRRREKIVLSNDDRRQILSLARDVPAIWNAPTTTSADKKVVLRMLIREIVLVPVDVPTRMTRIKVLWVTGNVSELSVPRPKPREATRTPPASVEELRRCFLAGYSDAEVAAELNSLGVQSGKKTRWTAASVRYVRKSYGFGSKKRGCRPGTTVAKDQREDGMYSIRGVANLLGVTRPMVLGWMKMGHITPTVGGEAKGRTCWFKLEPADVERLRNRVAELLRRGYGPGARRPTVPQHAHPISKKGVHCV